MAHDRDGLRDFLEAAFALADGHGAGGVGTGVFGVAAEAVADDAGGTQLHGVVALGDLFHGQRAVVGDAQAQTAATQRLLRGRLGAELAAHGTA